MSRSLTSSRRRYATLPRRSNRTGRRARQRGQLRRRSLPRRVAAARLPALVPSYVVDALGGWAYSVVLAVYVWDRTHSTQWLAAMASAGWLTSLLVGGYAGVLADRYERTRVMIVSALSSNAVVMCVIAVVVGTERDRCCCCSFLRRLSACGRIAVPPCVWSAHPEVVGEKRPRRRQQPVLDSRELDRRARPGGRRSAAAHRRASSPVSSSMPASFVVAAGIVSRLHGRATGDAARRGNAFKQWLVGIKALGRERVAMVLVLFCGLDSAIYGASTVMYVPLSEHLGTGRERLQLPACRRGSWRRPCGRAGEQARQFEPPCPCHFWQHPVAGAALRCDSNRARARLAFILQVISGAGMIVVDVLAYTALQRDLPREVLGRVLGVFDADRPRVHRRGELRRRRTC